MFKNRSSLWVSLAVLAAAATCSLGMTFDKAGNALEPKSSTSFPLKMDSLDLAGMAVRVKQIVFVGVQVYAVGLYVDRTSAELEPFKSKADVAGDNELYKALLQDWSTPKVLRLVMVRTVTGEQMGNALSEAVEGRLNKISTSNDAKDAFKQFKRVFSMPQLKTGTEILFEWQNGGKLVTKVDGQASPSIDSSPLCASLFDVFLGNEAVVERATLVQRVPELLAL